MTVEKQKKELDAQLKEIIKFIPVTWSNSDKFRELRLALKSNYVSAKESMIRKYKKSR